MSQFPIKFSKDQLKRIEMETSKHRGRKGQDNTLPKVRRILGGLSLDRFPAVH